MKSDVGGGVTVSVGLIRGAAFCISLTRKALCKTVHYTAVQCSEVPFSAVQCSAGQCSAGQGRALFLASKMPSFSSFHSP